MVNMADLRFSQRLLCQIPPYCEAVQLKVKFTIEQATKA